MLDVIQFVLWFLVMCPFVAGLLVNCDCCDTCTIFTDDFSTDRTGTDYTTSAGTWAVSGGVLTCTTASALITADTAVTAGLTGVYATVTFTPATTSDIGGLVIAYTDDNNYWYCEVQAGATDGTLKLFQRSSGVNTQKGTTRTLTGFQATETATITMCDASGIVLASATATAPAASAAETAAASITIAGTKCGLATGAGSSSVAFDSFSFSKHDIDDPACPFCDLSACNVCADMLPDSIEVTIPTDYSTSADPFNPCLTQACCDTVEGQTYVLTLREAVLVDNICTTGSATDCYYHHIEYLCDGDPLGCSGTFWSVEISAYFSGGDLTVVIREGNATVGNETLTTVESRIVFRATIGTGLTCEGSSWNVPFLTKCTNGGCPRNVTPSDLVVAV